VADDWLRSVNKDLVTCECSDAEKVRFTAHLLEGPTAMWWETYQITRPIEGLDWDIFREGFRNAHILGHYECEEGGVPHSEAGWKDTEGIHG
jgi:hypothetical protein